MATAGKRDVAAKNGQHKVATPPAVSLNPPTPPAGPVPAPYPYLGDTSTAKGTKGQLKIGGKPVVVKSSTLAVNPPANSPALPSGDVVTAAKKQKIAVTDGSSSLKAGGKVVAITGSMTAANVFTGQQSVAQQMMPLLSAGGGDAGGGSSGGSGGGKGKKKRPLPPRPSAKCTKAGHPVDVAKGYVVDEAVDLALPGAIPVLFRRFYTSSAALDHTRLGTGGWLHSYDQWIEAREGGLALEAGEGRQAWFEGLAEGGSAFNRQERLTLTQDRRAGSYIVYSHNDRTERLYERLGGSGRSYLQCIRDAFGNRIEFHYEGDVLSRIVDTAGREIRVLSDDKRRIVRLEVWAAPPPVEGQADPAPAPTLEQWFDYTYHPEGELASATNALGHSDTYEYDGLHRMVRTTLKNGVSFYYEYGEDGRCARTWGDNGLHEVELYYDDAAGTTTTSATNEPRVYYHNEQGVVTREETIGGEWAQVRVYDDDEYLLSEANAAGEATIFEYDERGNLIKSVDAVGNETAWEVLDDSPVTRTTPDGLVTRARFDRGKPISTTYPTGATIERRYDGAGRLIEVVGPEGRIAALRYDAHHNLASEMNARGAVTHYRYDALGRPVERIDAEGRRTTVSYDLLGQPVSILLPDGGVTRIAYDELGNVRRSEDALGHITRMDFRGTGTLRRLTRPDGTEILFDYDSDERLERIINARKERYEFRYDWAGRVIQERSFDKRYHDYHYNQAGRLTRVVYPGQDWREFAYDRLGNVVQDRTVDGAADFKRDALGRIEKATIADAMGAVVTGIERDQYGRVVREVQGDHEVRYEYDALNRRRRREIGPVGSAKVTQYRYEPDGAFSAVDHEGHKVLIQRDRLGREVRRHVYAGQVDIESRYDAMDQLAEQRVSKPGNGVLEVLAQRGWHYDLTGQVTRIDDRRWGTTSYRYDEHGQLKEARTGSRVEVFDYDLNGSLERILTDLGGSRMPWEVASGNRLHRTDKARYEDDDRGRRVTKIEFEPGEDPGPERILPSNKVTRYAWDSRDRLREVLLADGRKARYQYDAFGRRVRKEVVPAERGDFAAMLVLATKDGVDALPPIERTTFIWDGDVICQELKSPNAGGGDGVKTYVHEPGTFVPMLHEEQGAVFTYVVDHLGTPRELIDRDGRVAWAGSFSAWGREADEYRDPKCRWRVEVPWRLLGQYADAETGLCSTRFRYFDGEAGRWLSPDPLGLDGGANLFGFDGTPTVDSDPLGLASFLQIGEMADDDMNTVGDKLDRHEVLQHAWLKQNVPGYGGRADGRNRNPAVALESNRMPGLHRDIDRMQRAVGLTDPSQLANMKATDVIDLNIEILRIAMLDRGISRGKTNDVCRVMRRRAMAFARRFVPPCKL